MKEAAVQWLSAGWAEVLMMFLSAAVAYATIILCTRLAGLRSFSKMSSFDFAMTVAIGSTLSAITLTKQPALLLGVLALAALYAAQMLVGRLRQEAPWIKRVVDNQPLLLMAGEEVLEENLRRARITPDDLRAKLREANVLAKNQVRAVVLETTGDISVLHGGSDNICLDLDLFLDVRGRDALRAPRRATGSRERAG